MRHGGGQSNYCALLLPQVILVLFIVIRKLVWDYGRLALVQKEDEG